MGFAREAEDKVIIRMTYLKSANRFKKATMAMITYYRVKTPNRNSEDDSMYNEIERVYFLFHFIRIFYKIRLPSHQLFVTYKLRVR